MIQAAECRRAKSARRRWQEGNTVGSRNEACLFRCDSGTYADNNRTRVRVPKLTGCDPPQPKWENPQPGRAVQHDEMLTGVAREGKCTVVQTV